MKPTRNSRDPERGIALVLVLLVLLLCSILALEIKTSATLHMRLAKNKRDDLLMREGIRGQLEVLKQVLLYDKKENEIETLQDRWTEDRYTSFQDLPDEEELANRDPSEPVSSQDFDLEARIEDCARKFNLMNLAAQDKELRAHWEKVFVRLLVLYREENSTHAIAEGEAEQLLENVKEWLKRSDNDNEVPRPATTGEEQNRIIVTPDELLMVDGFTREMFYDLKPEEEDEETIPGLYRYLTVWSAGPVNLNTAEYPVLAALFSDRDRDLADTFIEWRETEAEEQDESLDPDEEPKNNALKSLAELSNIDGFEQAVIERNRLAQTATVRGDRFSLSFKAENSEGLRRQERWVLERNGKGFQTILMEVRNDPDTDRAEDEEEQ